MRTPTPTALPRHADATARRRTGSPLPRRTYRSTAAREADSHRRYVADSTQLTTAKARAGPACLPDRRAPGGKASGLFTFGEGAAITCDVAVR